MPRHGKYLPLLVFAATTLSPVSLSAQQSTVTGEWEAEWSRWDNQPRLYLDIRTRIDGHRIHSGSSIEGNEFTGDVPRRNTSGRIQLQFELDREAGTFVFEGTQNGREARGDFTWTAKTGYASDMSRLGYPRLSLGDQFKLCLQNVTTSYVAAIQDRGYRNLALDDLVQFAIFDVSAGYIDAMAAAGYDDIPAGDLIRFRIHGVDSEYVVELAELGFDHLSRDDLVRVATTIPPQVRLYLTPQPLPSPCEARARSRMESDRPSLKPLPRSKRPRACARGQQKA